MKHTSGFSDRREKLCRLIDSIRTSYLTEPILVAYDDTEAYETGREPCAAPGVEFVHLGAHGGLSAGRNAIVRRAQTEFVMIVDDDVEFIETTSVETLIGHLRADPALLLAAACYEGEPDGSWSKVFSNPCYAHNFTLDGSTMMTSAAPAAYSEVAGLHRSHLTHNVFVGRTVEMRALPWDERQAMMEHTTFFLMLQAAGWAVGYDPSVRVRHNDMDKSDVYKSGSVRFNEGRYLQYLCRNFPRVRRWELPFMDVDCEAHAYLRQVPDDAAVGRATRAAPIAWDASDDTSTVEYRPPKLSMFIAILSARDRTTHRDALRRSWLRTWAQQQSAAGSGGSTQAWDYGFFVGVGECAAERCVPTSKLPMRGDVVTLQADDSYDRLGNKVLKMLRWATEMVDSNIILKADEDTWVNALTTAQSLKYVEASAAFYGGMLTHKGQHPVLREGKWRVDRKIVPYDTYPEYARGGAYVLSRSTAVQVVEVVEAGLVPMVSNVEDATIGMACRAAGVDATAIDGFRELCDGRPCDIAGEHTWEASSGSSPLLLNQCCEEGVLAYHKPAYGMDVCDACYYRRHGEEPPVRAEDIPPTARAASMRRLPELSPSLSPSSMSPLTPAPPRPPTPPWLPDRVGERVVSTDAELQRAVSDPATERVTFAAERIVLSRTLELDHDITLVGPAVLDAAAQGFRVVHVKAGVNAALVDLTLTGSYDTNNAVAANGRRAQESGQDAFGVFNEGNMTIRGATIADFVRRALDPPPPHAWPRCAGLIRASRACAAGRRRRVQRGRHYDDQRHHHRQQLGG